MPFILRLLLNSFPYFLRQFILNVNVENRVLDSTFHIITPSKT